MHRSGTEPDSRESGDNERFEGDQPVTVEGARPRLEGTVHYTMHHRRADCPGDDTIYVIGHHDKTPQKAVSLLRAATRGWEGTFSDGCCHRLLANRFLSAEANPAKPGGFMVFMFQHPKTVDMGAKAFNSTTATLREYFGMVVDDTTVEYYAKEGFFTRQINMT